MDRLLGIVGTVVFTSKSLYYVAGFGYWGIAIFTAVSAYLAEESKDFGVIVKDCDSLKDELSALTQWIMITNIVALASGLMFYKFEKGDTISVIGSLLFLVNFLQVIVLFFYTQVKIFDTDVRECKDEAKKDTSFIW